MKNLELIEIISVKFILNYDLDLIYKINVKSANNDNPI